MDDLDRALRDPGTHPHDVGSVQVLETHISRVYLAGEFAYKVKKPVDLGFLDYSTLARRRAFCFEEVRLNRRLAPELYLGVRGLHRTPAGIRLGEPEDAAEYAVQMRCFRQEDQLDRCLADGRLSPEDMSDIAETIARFHDAADVAPADAPWGHPAQVLAPAMENFDHLRAPAGRGALAGTLDDLQAWTRDTGDALADTFEQRRDNGRIRECHGDLHLRNMARFGGRILAFDGIEFDPLLRWIDVASDAAFLVMDLESRRRPDLGQRFLNGWLSGTGDFESLAVLDFYRIYRHLVRAKVDSIRLGQDDVTPDETARLEQRLADHVAFAEAHTQRHRAGLLLMRGLSGSGKSWLSRSLADALPAVCVRSDVERKRLHGLTADVDAGAPPGEGIYSAEATERTYRRLADVARLALGAGHDVILDATFLDEARRRQFEALADEVGVPALVVSCEADEATLRRRVRERVGDASDARVSILEHQLDSYPASLDVSSENVLAVDTSKSPNLAAVVGQVRARLSR